ncbi:MAG: hypothetical protein KUL86_11550 [Castellaniella sp.]|nr:hypothetical protein [Castellaniella sp.]
MLKMRSYDGQDPAVGQSTSFVIATSRPWNEGIARRLEKKTGHTFHIITKKEDLTPQYLIDIKPRYIFFPHWSHIIPAEIYDQYECVIFHMTDLPYGRGGSPLQNLIVRGHRETQISALRCVESLDAGPVYMKRPLRLEGAASEIFSRAARIIADMIEELIREQPEPRAQEGVVTIFARRTPAESNLAHAHITDLNDFFDFIRMLDAKGYPRAFIDLHGYRIELSRVRLGRDKLVGTFVISR